VTAEERNALMAACDCYVSLHRSEGFGLTIAEAMAYGKPTIATAYSGNLTYMTSDNSYLVPWRPTTIPGSCAPYPAGAEWADPDLDAAAALMRRVFTEREEAEARGARALRDLQAHHTTAHAAAFVRRRLGEIWDGDRGVGAAGARARDAPQRR
jgi:glycosyltransferase involved in cell wall biosynthesis